MAAEPQFPVTLSDSDKGLFKVTTRVGTSYQLDLDSRTFQRTTKSAAQPLRRDMGTIDVVMVVMCRIGARLDLLIDLHKFDVDHTLRTASEVLQITQISGSSERAREWADLLAVIDAAGGNSAEVKRRAMLDSVSVDVITEAVVRYFQQAVATRGAIQPFGHLEALLPGLIDLRVFDQSVWWVDVLRRPHPIAEMSRDYLNNVIDMFVREADQYCDGYHAFQPNTEKTHDVHLWLESTPLMVALRWAVANELA